MRFTHHHGHIAGSAAVCVANRETQSEVCPFADQQRASGHAELVLTIRWYAIQEEGQQTRRRVARRL